jgi:hypothetical protein
MAAATLDPKDRELRPPRNAAIAGVISGILFIFSLTLANLIIPQGVGNVPAWIKGNVRVVLLALNLVPFAGISFLWFMGVARDHLGSHEDKFFATIFMGAGFLYLGITFVATAFAFGLMAIYTQDTALVTSTTYAVGIVVIDNLTFVFGSRMAAVFMIASATMWLRTKVMARWLALLTYLLALVLLFVISVSSWVILIFPGWMLFVSLIMLIADIRRQPVEGAKQAGS